LTLEVIDVQWRKEVAHIFAKIPGGGSMPFGKALMVVGHHFEFFCIFINKWIKAGFIG
jgi:hypothetical protein